MKGKITIYIQVAFAFVFFLILSTPMLGQEKKSKTTDIYFEVDSASIDFAFKTNKISLSELALFIDSINNNPNINISNVVVESFASPDGGAVYNKKLALRRNKSIFEYLTVELQIPDSLIEARSGGIAWEQIFNIVSNSNMKYSNEVLNILKNVPEETWKRKNPNDRWPSLVDSRNKHLMDLRGGVPYNYMLENYFPLVRKSNVITVYFEDKSVIPVIPVIPVPVPKDTIEVLDPIVERDTVAVEQDTLKTVPTKEHVEVLDSIAYDTIPMFALKTNLLYDAATLINVELEVPIGDRFSVAGEWIGPWWIWDNGKVDSKRHRIQTKIGTLEGKYWFGDRTDMKKLTGWYAGAYGTMGSFDFERDRQGIQAKNMWSAGLSAGYAHTINKKGNLRLEYSLSLGYAQFDYKEYTAEFDGTQWGWDAYRDFTKKFTWIGPTKAKVSLVWMINRKREKKNDE